MLVVAFFQIFCSLEMYQVEKMGKRPKDKLYASLPLGGLWRKDLLSGTTAHGKYLPEPQFSSSAQ